MKASASPTKRVAIGVWSWRRRFSDDFHYIAIASLAKTLKDFGGRSVGSLAGARTPTDPTLTCVCSDGEWK